MNQLLKLVQEYSKIKKLHVSCYTELSTIRDAVKNGKCSLEEIVNLVSVIREVSKLTNDLRKEADGVQNILENVACAVYIGRNIQGPIRASLATATPQVRLNVKLPNRNKNPEEYNALLNFFGVTITEYTNKAVRLHWPTICEAVSILAEQGKPTPPGLNPEDTYPIYSMRLTIKRDLDEIVGSLDKVTGKEVEATFENALTNNE